MENVLIKMIEKEHQDYLKDESRKVGEAESISFPKSEKEVIDILNTLNSQKMAITTQGARTGIAAGAVPQGGHILSLSRMNRTLGLRYDEKLETYILRVEAGAVLTQVRETLKTKEFDTEGWDEGSLKALESFKNGPAYFFSPDPTEATASIGGMVACNASGACSFKYGPTRNHIEALRVALADGDILALKRGEHVAVNGHFSIITESGKLIEGNVPQYIMPQVKNASGYYTLPDMDLVDLFIGSDGTLGVITEVEIRLLKSPAVAYGVTAFFSCEENSLKFVRIIREELAPTAIEFFNSKALDLLRKERGSNPAFGKLLDLPSHFHTAVYTEYVGDDENSVLDMVMRVGEIIEACGGKEDDTWVATSPQAKDQLHYFRHAIPEAVNLLIDNRRKTYPSITKLGTDMAVGDDYLEEIMNLYNECLEKSGLESATWGHIGNNHVHVNIIPRDMEDYAKGKEIISSWAEKVISLGGTVSAEHGIGKMKTNLLQKMFGEKGISEMKALKNLFDSESRLNKGNLFEE